MKKQLLAFLCLSSTFSVSCFAELKVFAVDRLPEISQIKYGRWKLVDPDSNNKGFYFVEHGSVTAKDELAQCVSALSEATYTTTIDMMWGAMPLLFCDSAGKVVLALDYVQISKPKSVFYLVSAEVKGNMIYSADLSSAIINRPINCDPLAAFFLKVAIAEERKRK